MTILSLFSEDFHHILTATTALDNEVAGMRPDTLVCLLFLFGTCTNLSGFLLPLQSLHTFFLSARRIRIYDCNLFLNATV
jgi:hypothetical protein